MSNIIKRLREQDCCQDEGNRLLKEAACEITLAHVVISNLVDPLAVHLEYENVRRDVAEGKLKL